MGVKCVFQIYKAKLQRLQKLSIPHQNEKKKRFLSYIIKTKIIHVRILDNGMMKLKLKMQSGQIITQQLLKTPRKRKAGFTHVNQPINKQHRFTAHIFHYRGLIWTSKSNPKFEMREKKSGLSLFFKSTSLQVSYITHDTGLKKLKVCHSKHVRVF